MKISLRLWQGARPRRAGVQCEKTEAAIQEPIAAPAWPRYGTRPPFTNLCDLRAVRAAGGGSDFAAGVGHPARAGAPWVGFSGLEVLRDHALDDMPSPMASETRFTSQIPGSPAAHARVHHCDPVHLVES